MAKMDDWMRQDKSVNSNLQESNRCSPSACVQWHLERKEYLCITLASFISRPFLWVLCKDKNRGSALSLLDVQDQIGFSWASCMRFWFTGMDF